MKENHFEKQKQETVWISHSFGNLEEVVEWIYSQICSVLHTHLLRVHKEQLSVSTEETGQWTEAALIL